MECNSNTYKCYSCSAITDMICPTCNKWSVCDSCLGEIIKTTIHCKMKVCCDQCNSEFDQIFINKFIHCLNFGWWVGFWCGWAKLNVVFLGRQVRWQNTSFNFAKRWHFVVQCQHKCLMLAGPPALQVTVSR